MIILNPWTYERIHVCTHYVKKRILIEDREEKKVEISKSFWDLFHALVRFRSIKLKQSVRYVRRPIEFLLCGSVPEKLICLYRTCDKLYRANEQITIKEWNSFINSCPNIFAREEREKKWNPLVPAPFFALSWRQLSDYLFLYYLNCFYPCLTFSWHVFFFAKTVKARSGGREENWSLRPSTSEFWTIFFKYSKNKRRFWLLALR